MLETIDECMTEKVDNCKTLADRWTNIGNKVYELSRAVVRNRDGVAVRIARDALSEWNEVEASLETYEMLVEDMVSDISEVW